MCVSVSSKVEAGEERRQGSVLGGVLSDAMGVVCTCVHACVVLVFE